MTKTKRKLITKNKKAGHEYFIEERLEAGIVLTGTEIKSIRMGKVNLKESFARIDKGEVYIYGMHISPYEFGNIHNVDPLRPRKLLLHKKEINKLLGFIKEKGNALVPISLYLDENGRAKLELGVGKGKKLYDKRDAIAKKDAQRRMQQETRKNRLY